MYGRAQGTSGITLFQISLCHLLEIKNQNQSINRETPIDIRKLRRWPCHGKVIMTVVNKRDKGKSL